MAISVVAASAGWTTLTADGAVALVGTPQAGDRYYVFATWKDFSVTAQITSPQAWNEVTEFANGTTASGNGSGSMKVGAWYRDWVSGDGNPTLDFSAAIIGGACVVLLRKDSSDSWDTPLFVTGAPSVAATWSATSSSTLTVKDGALVFELAGWSDDSATMTRSATTALEDDGSPNVTWNGNVVETVATHFSTTTGNDASGDLVHRFVTTGAAGVNLTGTGTLAAAEAGSVLWVHQGVTVSNDRSGSGSTSTASSTSATGRKEGRGSGSLSAASSVVAVGRKVGPGSAATSTATATSSSGRKDGRGSASLSTSTSVTAAGRKGVNASPTVPIVSSTSATPGATGRRGAGLVSVSVPLSASGSKQGFGSATVPIDVDVVFDDSTDRSGSASISVGTSTSASGFADKRGSGSVVVSSSTSATGEAEQPGEQPSGPASLTVSTSIVAAGFSGRRGSGLAVASTSTSASGTAEEPEPASGPGTVVVVVSSSGSASSIVEEISALDTASSAGSIDVAVGAARVEVEVGE